MIAWRMPAQQAASLIGKVYTEATLRPIADAEIMLPELSKSTTSDEKGAFRIVDIPAGTYLVRARRIGFAVYEARVEFRAGKTADRPIVLRQTDTAGTCGSQFLLMPSRGSKISLM